MNNMELEINTGIQIQKTPAEVFEAIVDPGKMSNYFISQSTGKMEEGKNLIWKFPEFDMEVPIRVGKIIKDQFVSYYWMVDEKELLVEIKLIARENNSTLVSISEKSMLNNTAGINWLKGNTEGWANFLACLKAYLEYGINLRKGGFDYRKK